MNPRQEEFLKNLGSGLSLFSSIIFAAVAVLMFFKPGTDILLKLVVGVILVGIKTTLFHSLMKTLQARVNKRLAAVYVIDVIGMLIILFAGVPKLAALGLLVLWVAVSFGLAVAKQ